MTPPIGTSTGHSASLFLEPSSVVDEYICGILFRGHCHPLPPPVEFRQLLSGRTDQAAISFGLKRGVKWFSYGEARVQSILLVKLAGGGERRGRGERTCQKVGQRGKGGRILASL